jgi:hypothetical protein
LLSQLGAPIVGFVGDIKMAQRTNGECAEELGGEGVPESHPLQQPPQRPAFRDSTLRCPMRARPSSRFVRRDNEKNGARVSPADLPVQNPTKFNLTISQPPKRWT